MIIDQVPLSTVWKFHAGAPVSDCAPKVYGMLPNPDGSATFTVSGSTVPGKYAGAEWYYSLPLRPGMTRLCMSYYITVSPSYSTDCQAAETDIIAIDSQRNKYNASEQNAQGILEVGVGSGGWANTMIPIGKYTPTVPHFVQIYYAFDWTKKTVSIEAVVVDLTVYPVPVKFQNVPAVATNWTPNEVLVQIQLTLTAQAGEFSETISNLQLQWV